VKYNSISGSEIPLAKTIQKFQESKATSAKPPRLTKHLVIFLYDGREIWIKRLRGG